MTSPSTLSRKAAKSKNPKEAKKLRAIAAKLRREQRARDAKGPKFFPGVKEEIIKGKGKLNLKALDDARNARNLGKALGAAIKAAEPAADATGWREVTPAPLIDRFQIDQLRKLARAKGFAFEDGIRMAMMGAHSEGRRTNDVSNTQRMKTIHEVNSINVVCAFIAEMNGIMALNKGPLPPVIMVAGFTMARVLDALRDAGYTTEGKTGMQRRG